jgi:hypothetical protein
MHGMMISLFACMYIFHSNISVNNNKKSVRHFWKKVKIYKDKEWIFFVSVPHVTGTGKDYLRKSPEVVFRSLPYLKGYYRCTRSLCYQAQTPVWSESSVDEHNLYFARSVPCSPQVESALRPAQLIWAASLPYCTGLLYRHDLPKFSRLSNVRGRGYFDSLFWEKSKT